jgi:dolichol kinase
LSYNVITLPVTLIFITNAFGQLIYALKLNKQFPKEHNFKNVYLIFVLWITAGLCYPFFYSKDDVNIRWFQGLSNFFICIFTPLIIFLILFYQYFAVVKRDLNIKEKRNIYRFVKEFEQKLESIDDYKSFDLKRDLRRKGLHLFPAGVIILLWIFAVYIWEGIWHADEIWGISGRDYGVFLILTVGYSGILIFAALDYVRLSFIFKKSNIYHLLPNTVLDLLSKAMKRNELFEFIKSASLVLALVPGFFLPAGLFISIALIATLADGAASILGKRFGRRRFPKKSQKTIVGYISGFISAFLIGFICLLFFEHNLDILKIIIISLAGAITFFVIDFLNLKIDDNILNPLLCAFIMGIFYVLFI